MTFYGHGTCSLFDKFCQIGFGQPSFFPNLKHLKLIFDLPIQSGMMGPCHDEFSLPHCTIVFQDSSISSFVESLARDYARISRSLSVEMLRVVRVSPFEISLFPESFSSPFSTFTLTNLTKLTTAESHETFDIEILLSRCLNLRYLDLSTCGIFTVGNGQQSFHHRWPQNLYFIALNIDLKYRSRLLEQLQLLPKFRNDQEIELQSRNHNPRPESFSWIGKWKGKIFDRQCHELIVNNRVWYEDNKFSVSYEPKKHK